MHGHYDHSLPLEFHHMRMQAELASQIEEHGFVVMLVFDPDGQKPLFAYTIGLHHTDERLPEVIMIGLSREQLLGFLYGIAHTMLTQKEVYEAGKTYSSLTENAFPCFFGEVDPTFYEEYVGQAINYYGDQAFPLLQGVWCDTKQQFPWQHFEERFVSLQPLLFRPEKYHLVAPQDQQDQREH